MSTSHPSLSRRRLRLAAWSLAVALLVAPLVAMQFTAGVRWGPGDFLFATILIGGTGLAFELLARHSTDLAYRGGCALALIAFLSLVWANEAVGLIGSEDNPANRWFYAVFAAGMLGAVRVRFRARGLAWVLSGVAFAHAAVALGLAFAGAGLSALPSLVFVAPWLASAWLFRRSAQGPSVTPENSRSRGAA